MGEKGGGAGIYTVRVQLEFQMYSSTVPVHHRFPPPLSSPSSPVPPLPPPAHTYTVEINSELKGTYYGSPVHKQYSRIQCVKGGEVWVIGGEGASDR